MKKLLITTMAAVSLAFCAKATLTEETFETYGEGSLFGTLPGDSSKYEISDGWETETTLENLFTVTNIENYVGADTYPEKANLPLKSDSVKALAIDTSAPLLRYADSSEDPQSLSDAPIFFDSVVQFTATDVAPSMENNTTDKLAVWLYATPEGTEGRLFGEDDAITNLVITAGYYDGDGNRWYTNYLTNVAIQPDTWHRLTIKAINDIGIHNLPTPGFEVYVDGNNSPVSGKCDYDGENPTLVTKFPSLIARDNSGVNYLQGVAFDGKGAVDDIVFTTTNPFAEAEPEKFTIDISEKDEMYGVLDRSYCIDDGELIAVPGSMSVSIPVGAKKIKFVVTMDSTAGNNTITAKFGDTDLAVTKVNDACSFEINVENADADETLSVSYTVVPYAGGSAKPTIGGNSYETEAALKAVVKSGTEITVPSGWTVEGKVLKDDKGATFATFEYYNLALANGVVTATLDQKAAAPFAAATDLTEGEEVLEVGEDVSGNPELTVRIKPYVGLYYGAMTGTALDNLTLTTDYQKATSTDVIEFTATGKAGDTASFIKIVVTDIAPEATEK